MKKLILILIVALFQFSANAQSKTSGPVLKLDKEVVDYGVISKGSDKNRTLKITNAGTAPLLVTGCTGSCGCTVPTCPKEPIMPGKSAQIKVNYDTERPGIFSKTITINSNDPATPAKTVPVKGEVKEGMPAN